mmetsp:Transcript_12638/g.25716  ORF Transcript_12638/g.25716 Transcript_12638/m.25716 type:complete len:278 (+) Transcript_12638:279-1112(+)
MTPKGDMPCANLSASKSWNTAHRTSEVVSGRHLGKSPWESLRAGSCLTLAPHLPPPSPRCCCCCSCCCSCCFNKPSCSGRGAVLRTRLVVARAEALALSAGAAAAAATSVAEPAAPQGLSHEGRAPTPCVPQPPPPLSPGDEGVGADAPTAGRRLRKSGACPASSSTRELPQCSSTRQYVLGAAWRCLLEPPSRLPSPWPLSDTRLRTCTPPLIEHVSMSSTMCGPPARHRSTEISRFTFQKGVGLRTLIATVRLSAYLLPSNTRLYLPAPSGLTIS